MEDKVRKFYDTVSQDYEMPDYDTFLANMQDSAKAQKFYDVVSQDYDMPEFNEFYGLFKKKSSSQDSFPKEFTLQSYSQETPITEKDWVGDIAVGAISKPEKPNYLKIREQNIDAINNLLTDLDKQYEVLNATIIEKEKDPAYQEELSKVLRQASGAYSPGGIGLSQSIREGMSPAREEIAARKKIAAARDMLSMAKKLNAKSNSELDKDKSWLGKLASSMKNADWIDVFTMGMKNLENTTELLDAARKAEKEGIDSLTTDEQAILVAYSSLQEASSMSDRSVSSMAGESMVASIPFLVQFALSGGISAGVKGTFTKVGKQLINKYGKNKASEMIIKGAVGTASLAAEGAVRSVAGVSPVQAVAKRKAETTQIDATIGQDGKVSVTRVEPTEGMAEAAVKGVTNNALEFAFESFGGVVGKGVKRVTDSAAKTAAIKAIGQTKAGRWMSAVNMDAKLVTKAKNQIGFNGFIGETVEELMTSYSQTAVTGDKPVLDAVGRKELLTILMSTATMSGTFATVNGTYKMLNRDKIAIDEQVKAELDDVLSRDLEAEQVAEEVDQIIASNAVSDKDVSNIVQYVAASAQEQANVTVTEFEKGLKGAEADKVEGLLNWDIKQMDEALASTEESSLADAREYDKEMDALDGELAKRVKNERIDALESELMDVESVERETEIKNELRTLYAEKNAKRTAIIGEIKAETPEVVSKPIREEKVAEMPTTEVKKEGVATEVNVSEEKGTERLELKDVESTAKALYETSIPDSIVKEGFTEGESLLQVQDKAKKKYGEKKGSIYNDVVSRLVNPNKNNIVEIRSNGVVVKENERYVFKPYTNTDANYKKWTLGRDIDVTEQYVGKISEEYHKAKAEGVNPELVKAVEDLINKKYAVEERKVQEGGVGEYQNVDEGRQKTETGRGDSVEQIGQEEIQKEEVNEEKGQREGLQVRTWASEIDDVAEMSIDIESMGREAAKEKVQEYKVKVDNVRKSMQDIITQNRSTLDKISPEYTKHLLRQVANAKPTNLKNTAQRIESIISNAQTQGKLEKAFKQRKKIKEALRNNPEYASFVRSLNVKAKAKEGGKNLAVEFNKVKVESLPEGLVEDYISVVDNLTSKTPDYGMVENFMKNYSTEIKREAEKASIPNFDPLKTAESLSKQAQELVDGVDMAQATPEAIMSLKRRLSGLLNHAEYLRKQGVMEMTEDDLKEFSQAEDGIKNYIENIIPKVSEDVKGKIEELEREYKTNAVKEITSKKLTFNSDEDAKAHKQLITKLNRIDVDNVSLREIENLNNSLGVVEETGVAPVIMHQLWSRVNTLDMQRKGEGYVIPALQSAREAKNTVKELFDKGEDYIKRKVLGKPEWATATIFGMGKRVKEAYDNPIYNAITHVGSEAINTSERNVNNVLNPLKKAFKEYRQNWFERYVYDFGESTKDRNVSRSIGILMAQVRFANLMKDMRGRVVARGGIFYAVDVEGNPYRVDEKIKVFKTAEEALDFVKTQPVDKLANGRELDFFDIVSYDYKDDKKTYSNRYKKAKFSSDSKLNNKEKRLMEDAYNDLVKRNGGKLNNINTEEDAVKLLNEDEMKFWQPTREVYANMEEQANIVAAREGYVLRSEDFYFPMNSKNMSDRAYDQSATLEDIYSQVNNKGTIGVTDNILKKTKRINFIDFDAFRATEKYVRDMSLSYHVLPVFKSQVEALNGLAKRYKEEDTDVETFMKVLKEDVVLGYRAEFARSSMFGNSKVWIGDKVINIGNGLRIAAQMAKNSKLNKIERPITDGLPNAMKLGFKTGLIKPREMASWNSFFFYNPGVIGAKSVNEIQFGRNKLGDYEAVTAKGKLQEWSDNWIGLSDRYNSSTAWMNKFPELYKELTGEEFDVVEYANNADYRDKVNNKDEFAYAKAMTDAFIEENTVPNNSYTSRKQMNSFLLDLKSDSKTYKLFNTMSSYQTEETMAALLYANEWALGNGRLNNVYRIGKLLASNMAFNLASQAGFNAVTYIAGALTDNDWAEEMAREGFKNMVNPEGLMGNGAISVMSLMLGGYMNFGRYLISVMYNGAFTAAEMMGDSKHKMKVRNDRKALASTMGRVINQDLDIMKEYMPTEGVLNTIVPFYAPIFKDFIQAGIELPKQAYNLTDMFINQKDWDDSDFRLGKVVQSANLLIGSMTLPMVANMNNGVKASMRDSFSSYMPVELMDEAEFIHSFQLTYMDMMTRFDDKYDQTLKGVDFEGIPRIDFSDTTEDPYMKALNKGKKSARYYIEEGENKQLLLFYYDNAPQIEALKQYMTMIVKDVSKSQSQKKKDYEMLIEETKILKKAYEDFKNGKDEKYVVSDKFIPLRIKSEINKKVESELKSAFKNQNWIELLKEYKDGRNK